MKSSFKNQLTDSEITKGILFYLYYRFFPLILILIIIPIITFINDKKNKTSTSFLLHIIPFLVILIIGQAFLFNQLKKQFSIKKIAEYRLLETSIEVISNIQDISQYKYADTRMISLSEIIILIYPHHHFSILSKSCLSDDQMQLFSQLISIKAKHFFSP